MTVAPLAVMAFERRRIFPALSGPENSKRWVMRWLRASLATGSKGLTMTFAPARAGRR